jgi:tetratricopeptide (TPR) repeat protein
MRAGVKVYTLAKTARILRVSPQRIRYWERNELVRRSAEEGGARGFAFADLIELRRLLGLVEGGVSVRRIRRGIDDLRTRVPGLDQPLGALRLADARSGRLVIHHEGHLEDPEGQLVLDFESAPEPDLARIPPPSPLEPLDGAESGDTALALFEHGCELDADPEQQGEAILSYRRALELDPEFADAACNLGTVHFNRGERERAREAYQQALEIDPRHLEANFNLGNLLEEEGRRELALRYYREAAEIDPLFADAQLNLALLCEKLELPRRAHGHWRRYLQLVPDGQWAELARERLGRDQPRG